MDSGAETLPSPSKLASKGQAGKWEQTFEKDIQPVVSVLTVLHKHARTHARKDARTHASV